MRASLCAILAAASAVSAQSSTIVDAPVVTSNPAGVSYIAKLPKIDATVVGTSSPDGQGVIFEVSVGNLPTAGGPFMYHLHEKPVPADGNCSGTGAHLDPYKRGEVPICDASNPQTCQTGDLSGKLFNFTRTSEAATYHDLYSSTDPENPAFFGDLSVVFHLSNKTRIACANFSLVSGGSPSSGYGVPTIIKNSTYSYPTATGTGSTPSSTEAPTYTSPAPTQPDEPAPTGAANQLMVTGAGILAAVMALVL